MNISPTTERAQILDVLRGFAIFGMFTVNMTADILWADLYEDLHHGTADFLSLVLVNLLTNGKFITIFSFLFGIGFFLQTENRIAAASSVVAFWFRRMSGLLMIGLIASACTLPARILIDYSIFGLGLLLFYRLSPRWILIAAISIFGIVQFFDLIVPNYLLPPDGNNPPVPTLYDTVHESIAAVQPGGHFLDISALQILHVWVDFTSWRYYAGDLDILALMLLGLYVGRAGAVWNPDIRTALAGRHVYWLIGVGFLSCTAWVMISQFGLGDESSEHLSVASNLLAWPLGMPVLGLGYAAAITLMMNKKNWRRRLMAFAPVGQMALTNYVFTGFVAAFISFQWGMGLYGKVYPALGLLIAVGLLPAQVIASRWWLNRFAFGPLEWLWRCWTYGQLLPVKRQNTGMSRMGDP